MSESHFLAQLVVCIAEYAKSAAESTTTVTHIMMPMDANVVERVEQCQLA